MNVFENDSYKKGYIAGYRDGVRDAQDSKVLSWDGNDVISAPIQVISISTRAINCLLRARCLQISDVAALDEYQIHTMRNMGQKTAAEIARWLESQGISLTAWSRYL